MAWRLCVSRVVSLALKPFNYNVHGHDVTVWACWCSPSRANVDVELLARSLEEALRKFDHKPLWEVLGVEGAMIEDLLLDLSGSLKSVGGLKLCSLSASWAGRSLELNL
ncbi:MAG: hypothetical protein ACK4H7_03975 [Acidilobaceae archaeon]